MGKELFESILILAELWLTLAVIPLFLLIRYLILSKIFSAQAQSSNTKYLILFWTLVNPSISSY